MPWSRLLILESRFCTSVWNNPVIWRYFSRYLYLKSCHFFALVTCAPFCTVHDSTIVPWVRFHYTLTRKIMVQIHKLILYTKSYSTPLYCTPNTILPMFSKYVPITKSYYTNVYQCVKMCTVHQMLLYQCGPICTVNQILLYQIVKYVP